MAIDNFTIGLMLRLETSSHNNMKRSMPLLRSPVAASLPKNVGEWTSLVTRAVSMQASDVPRPQHLSFVNVGTNTPMSRNAGVPPNADTLRKSAVLLLLSPVSAPVSTIEGQQSFMDMNILLTLRCSKMRTHAGQMALPGGRMDEGETEMQAASRECMEEVGVLDDHYNIVGALRPIWSHPSKSWVTPVVAVAPEEVFPQIRSPDEVESIHYLNLPNLLLNSAGTHHEQIRHWAALGTFRLPCFFASDDPREAAEGWRNPLVPKVHPGKDGNGALVQVDEDKGYSPVSVEECDGQLVWGLTAAIIAELIARIAAAHNLAATADSKIDLTHSGYLVRDPDHAGFDERAKL